MTVDEIRTLVTYERRADADVLASLRALGAVAPPRAVAVLAHVVGSQRLWLARIEGEPSPLAIWPALDLDGVARELAGLALPWDHLLGRLDEGEFARAVAYTTSRGERFTNRVDDILRHVFLHSSYHRGQIASTVREAGGQPAGTDYIAFIRGAPIAS